MAAERRGLTIDQRTTNKATTSESPIEGRTSTPQSEFSGGIKDEGGQIGLNFGKSQKKGEMKGKSEMKVKAALRGESPNGGEGGKVNKTNSRRPSSLEVRGGDRPRGLGRILENMGKKKGKKVTLKPRDLTGIL